MKINIKEIILESDFLSDEDLNNLNRENYIYKEMNPIQAGEDKNRLFSNAKQLAKNLSKDPEMVKLSSGETIENPINATKKHMNGFLSDNNYHNPTTSKFFNHLKSYVNAYGEVENHISNLPKNEQDAINKQLEYGNKNINAHNVLKGNPLFNNYNYTIEKNNPLR